MTTPARRYARHRWAVYGKLGCIIMARHGLSPIRYLVPAARHIVSDIEMSLDNLHLILTEHLRQMKATGSWRQL
jgi:hypothetical protein